MGHCASFSGRHPRVDAGHARVGEGQVCQPPSHQEEAGQFCRGSEWPRVPSACAYSDNQEYPGLSIHPGSQELLPRPSPALPSLPSGSGSGLICPSCQSKQSGPKSLKPNGLPVVLTLGFPPDRTVTPG